MYDVSGVHVSIPGGLRVDLYTRHITRKWKEPYTSIRKITLRLIQNNQFVLVNCSVFKPLQ